MKHIMGPNAESTLTNVRDDDIQPNAVDLRVDKILRINPLIFEISEESKVHRGSVEIPPDNDGFWKLNPGAYEIVMENIIHVGENEAGWVITRSTLNRNGVHITSGLYDSGYHGVMAGTLHVTSGPMQIKRGTRVGQFLLFKAEALKKYEGSYGLTSEHDKKYV
jgi:dCTP deaminase/dUTP pyrophosphatase